jgi:modification methylase
MPDDLPLSVWATAQQPAPTQRAGRYLPASSAHPAKMLPAIARTAIAEYTKPGDLVIDPMCGVGTTLVEAMHLGRQGIGIEFEPQWAKHARRNITHATDHGAAGRAEVHVGDGRQLATLIDPSLHGTAALVLTSPPYGPSLHGQVRATPGRGVAKRGDRYSDDPANLGAVDLSTLVDAVTDILTGAATLLRPGGVVAMTVRPWRHHGALVDLPGRIGQLASTAGLDLFERNVALLAGLRGDRLVSRSSFFALDHARRATRTGDTRLVIAHEDVLVFRRPST